MYYIMFLNYIEVYTQNLDYSLDRVILCYYSNEIISLSGNRISLIGSNRNITDVKQHIKTNNSYH